MSTETLQGARLAVRDMTLVSFIETIFEDTLEPWEIAICKRLESFKVQTGQRLIIGVAEGDDPGRITVGFSLWLLSQSTDPTILLCTCNKARSEQKVKSALGMLSGSDLNTAPFHINRTKTRFQEPLRSQGVGNGMAGLGFSTLVLTDIYGTASESASATHNNRLMDWWRETVMVRSYGFSNILIIDRLWHPDDFTGRLAADRGWETIYYRRPVTTDRIATMTPADPEN